MKQRHTVKIKLQDRHHLIQNIINEKVDQDQDLIKALSKYVPSLVLTYWTDQRIKKNQIQKKLESLVKLPSNFNWDQNNVSAYLDTVEQSADAESTLQSIEKYQSQLKQTYEMPQFQEMETVVLFADISGFTVVSEICSSMGTRGNEELAFVINTYMDGMVRCFSQYGGDIIKFVGDAMIVMWPRSSKTDNKEQIMLIRKAIQCAIDIQKDLHNKKISTKVPGLKVKIGIAWGKCALLYVGGTFNRSEYFTVGVALEQALEAESHCSEGGQIVVHQSAWQHVKTIYYDGEEVGEHFFKMTNCKIGVKAARNKIQMKDFINLDRIASIKQTLSATVPRAIIPYLEIGNEKYGCETRMLTIMFVSLGVILNDTSTEQGRNKIQSVLTVVQQQVYRQHGSLNKLMMDDKGCTLVCFWGASPTSHVDDATRAVLCALNMRRALKKVQDTWCNIGIATGVVFSGAIGSANQRREFSCLGDSANLAARIMCVPKKKNITGCILCDMRTKNEAMNQISFKYSEHAEFKGKSLSYPIYEPVDPFEEFQNNYLNDMKSNISIIAPQSMLKLGMNPLIIEHQVNHKEFKNLQTVHEMPIINKLFSQIKDYVIISNYKSQSRSLNIIIQGEMGTGKTYIMRSLCKKLLNDQDILKFNNIYNKFGYTGIAQASNQATMQSILPIFAGAPNAETRMQFLGSWRPILRGMFEYRRRQLNIGVADLLRLIVQDEIDKLDIILDIFGFYPQARYNNSQEYIEQQQNLKKLMIEVLNGREEVPQQQKQDMNNPNWFVNREQYSHKTMNCILDLCCVFIQEFVGQCQYPSQIDFFNQSIDSLASKDEPLSLKQGLNDTTQFCILLFDNLELLELESWTLILRIYLQKLNLCILMSVEQSSLGQANMPVYVNQCMRENMIATPIKSYENLFFSEERKIEKNYLQEMLAIQIPKLTTNDLKQILIDMAPTYREAYLKEISISSQYNGPTEGVNKTPLICQEQQKKLVAQYQLDRQFTSLDQELCDMLIEKCDANISICLQYFLQLLLNGYISIDLNGKVIMNQNLKQCLQLKNLNQIPVPQSIYKRRLKDLDEFVNKRNNETDQKEKDKYIKGLLILKAASVIGQEFWTTALKKIITLQIDSFEQLNTIMKELEQNNLIEIVDDSDSENIRCKFKKSFLRETLYQIMLFKDQKQVLHSNFAEHLLSKPTYTCCKTKANNQVLQLQEHFMIGEDITDYNYLSEKKKTKINKKKIQIFQQLEDYKSVISHEQLKVDQFINQFEERFANVKQQLEKDLKAAQQVIDTDISLMENFEPQQNEQVRRLTYQINLIEDQEKINSVFQQKIKFRDLLKSLNQQKMKHLCQAKLKLLNELHDHINQLRKECNYRNLVLNIIKIFDILDMNRRMNKNQQQIKEFSDQEHQSFTFLEDILIDIINQEDEEIYRVVYHLRMLDNDDDIYTNKVFDLVKMSMDPNLVSIFLMNKRKGRKLRWKDEFVDFKLSTGFNFQYFLKHDEALGKEKLYLIKYEEAKKQPFKRRNTLIGDGTAITDRPVYDNGLEGFQFILCDGGFHIQFGNYRLILNEKIGNFSQPSFKWYNNHNDFKVYSMPENTVFYFKMSATRKGSYYIEMPYDKYKCRLCLNSKESRMFSDLVVKRKKNNAYFELEIYDQQMLWKID